MSVDDARLLHLIGRSLSQIPDGPIGVAVSGGGDSMALLHLIAEAARGRDVLAVTVDHSLRAEAAVEAEGVATFCAGLGIEHTTLKWLGWDGHGNLQAEARDARYRLIGDWARAQGVGAVALGHTRADGAETFVMRLARKAGVDGLSAMDTSFERDGVHWFRPLWMTGRDALRRYLTRHDVSWIDDPSNDDVDFERVRVRKALTTLESIGVSEEALQHSSVAMRQARDALEHYVAIEAKAHVRVEGGDLTLPWSIDVPVEIERRLRTKALQWVGGLDYPPRLSSMRHLLEGLALEGRQTLGGCLVVKKDETLRFSRELNAVRQMTCATDQIWDGKWAFDGPRGDDLRVAALGDGVLNCADWRETGLPRASVMASPAIWRGDTLISAPIAGFSNGWAARIVADFHSSLLTH